MKVKYCDSVLITDVSIDLRHGLWQKALQLGLAQLADSGVKTEGCAVRMIIQVEDHGEEKTTS